MQKKAKNNQPKWKRILKKTLLTLIIVLLLFLIGWYAYNTLTAKYRRTFTGYNVETGSIVETNEYSGKIQLIDSTIITAAAPATVRKVFVAPGDDVKKDDKLIRLSDGTIYKAEYDGRINTVSVIEGEEIAAGKQLLTMADFTHVKVNIRVDEYDAAALYVGKECSITTTASKETYTSAISSLNRSGSSTGYSNSSIAYYQATLLLDVTDDILPGMQVTVTFTETLADHAVILKKSALSFDEKNSAYVWVKNEAGEPEQKYVEIGVYNDDYVQLLSGAASGDVVYHENENNTNAATGLMAMFSNYRTTPSSNRGNWSNRGNGTGMQPR